MNVLAILIWLCRSLRPRRGTTRFPPRPGPHGGGRRTEPDSRRPQAAPEHGAGRPRRNTRPGLLTGEAPMLDTPTVVAIVGFVALVALAAGFLVARALDKARGTGADARIAEMLAAAGPGRRDGAKEAELKAKDELFKKREEFNREIEQNRERGRASRNAAWKSARTASEQKHQAQLKKERSSSTPRRKLHERSEQLEKRPPGGRSPRRSSRRRSCTRSAA